MSSESKNGEPILPFASPKSWSAWLSKHHSGGKAVWIKVAKKNTGIATVTHQEALDEALCWGWIDAQRGPYDETWFVQRFCPRGRSSTWSVINQGKVARLISEGRMQPAGQREIDRAKENGEWERAYEGAKNIKPTEDLLAAFAKKPKAFALFNELDSTNRFAVMFRVQTAKKPETRAARIEKFVEMLERGETIYPRKGLKKAAATSASSEAKTKATKKKAPARKT